MEQITLPDGTAGRLDSWKEIALFFSKDVRTVKRWEKRGHFPYIAHPASPVAASMHLPMSSRVG